MAIPTPFISNQALWQQVYNAVKPPIAIGLPDIPWLSIIAAANLEATADILEALGGLGFTPAQIRSCDYVTSWANIQGVYRALKSAGAGLHPLQPAEVDALDQREYLLTKSFLIIGDAAVGPTPNASPVGGIVSGSNSAARAAALRSYNRASGYGCNPNWNGGGWW